MPTTTPSLSPPLKVGRSFEFSPKVAADAESLVPSPGEVLPAALRTPKYADALWDIQDEATFRAVAEYKREWEALKCLCGGSKWKFYPFCRSCTIRVLRVQLYRLAFKACQEHKAGRFPESWRGYDTARDFLMRKQYHRPVKREDEDAA